MAVRTARLVLLLPLLAWVGGGCRSAAVPGAWTPGSGAPRPARVAWKVAGRPQAHSLSCEARSACDLLAWHGLEVTEETFLAGLPRSDDPEEGFVGSVDDPGGGLPPSGYGVYEGPIARRLRELGLAAEGVRGLGLEALLGELACGRCVIVWATAALDAPPTRIWTDARGRSVPVVPGEHTYLAVGYAPGSLLLLDPATGRCKSVSSERFRRSWAVLGERAVTTRADRSVGP